MTAPDADAARLDQLASTPSARWRWTRSRRPTAATPARRWPWRRWPTRSGSSSCATIPPTRSGRTATASCSPAATPRCCSTRCCTWPASRRWTRTTSRSDEPSVPLDEIKRFRQLDSRCPGHPEYRWTTRRRNHHRPAGPGRRQQRRHGDRRQLAGRALQPARLRAVRLQRLRLVQRRRPDGRRLQRSRLARRPPEALEPLLDLRRQPHHHRRPHRLAFSEDVATRFVGLRLERHRASTTPTTWPRSRAAFRTFQKTHGPADADHRATASSATARRTSRTPARAHGEPLGEEEIRLTKRVYGWPEDAKFLVPDGVLRALPRRHRQARPRAARRLGRAASTSTRRSIPSWPTQLDRCSTAQLPEGWDKDLPTFPADAKGMASRVSSGKVLNAVGQERALAARRLGRPGPVDQDAAHVRRSRRLRGRQATAAATSTSASASTAWPRSATAWRCPGCGPTARPSWSSAITPRPSMRLAALMEIARSSTSSRTTRSASAKTADASADRAAGRRCGRFPA